MEFELAHVSAPGGQFTELAEKHAADFAVTADGHDRQASFPVQNWTEMRQSGLLAATVPAELGGMGVTAIHDIVVAISRLGRGDGSTAIGVAMHVTALWYLARMLSGQPGSAAGQQVAAGLRLVLRRCARGRAVACVAISEPGTSLGCPRTTAEPGDGGYRISGRKSFCTNSPVATMFLTSVRVPAGEAGDRLGFALIPRETPGVTVLDNWDALGMRASGSGDVVYSSCPLSPSMVTALGPVGVLSADILSLTMVGALVLAGAFLGLAEQAHQVAIAGVTGRRDQAVPAFSRTVVQEIIGENETGLAISRGVLSRTALLLAERLPPLPPAAGASKEMHGLMKEVQCANMAVKRSAIAIVDRSLTALGGRGYLNSSPLSRLYRDVRAGPFMQPFSALDAFEYIGRSVLGINNSPG